MGTLEFVRLGLEFLEAARRVALPGVWGLGDESSCPECGGGATSGLARGRARGERLGRFFELDGVLVPIEFRLIQWIGVRL